MNIKSFQIKNVEASSTLLFVAIVIELLVAGLGVFLGIVMVTEGSTQIEVPLLNRFVPAMMFFVVAVVELTRVPLIISIYRSHSFLWQIFGSIFLLLIMFIAFETMSVGFKRNVMMMEGDLNVYRIDKNNLTNQLNSIIDEIEENKDLSLETINQNYNDTIDNLNKERENRLAPYYKTLDDIETIQSGSLDGALGNKIEVLNQQIIQLNQQRDNEISNIQNKIDNQVSDLNKQISDLNNRKIQVNAQIAALPQGFLGGVSKQKLDPLNKEIEIITKSINSKERQINTLNNSINSELSKINSKYEKTISDAQNQLNQANNEAIESESVRRNSFDGQVKNANKAIKDITEYITNNYELEKNISQLEKIIERNKEYEKSNTEIIENTNTNQTTNQLIQEDYYLFRSLNMILSNGSEISVFTGLVYDPEDVDFPTRQYCYTILDKLWIDLANKEGAANQINFSYDNDNIGIISLNDFIKAQSYCRFKNF